MARHRHAVSVRTDGLAAVLGPLLADPRIRHAALIDADSGMVLDVCGPDTAAGRYGSGRAAEHDHRDEVRGAAHAELVRIGLALAPGSGGVLGLVLEAGPDRHVLRTVADPHGGRLALSVVVRGPDRVVRKVRKRLRAVSEAALTAGPSVAVRPGSAGWTVPGAAGKHPARSGTPAGDASPPGVATAPHGPRTVTSPRPATGAASSVPAALPVAPASPPADPPATPATEDDDSDRGAGDHGGGDHGAEVEATAPHTATAPSAAPATAWPGRVAPLSAMLPSPRPRADAPAAPADPVDPAPADR